MRFRYIHKVNYIIIVGHLVYEKVEAPGDSMCITALVLENSINIVNRIPIIVLLS